MGKRNPTHVLTLLHVILSSYTVAQRYYIQPNDSTSGLCQNYSDGTCFTLAEFASFISHLDQDNLTLSFLPGEHLLTRRIRINGLENITLTGQDSSKTLSTIRCQGTSGFEFGDIQVMDIAYLHFTGCGNVLLGGAIFIERADNVLIRGCNFTDNYVVGDTSSGGAIYVENTVAMEIKETSFGNNYAAGENSEGGAIYASLTSTNDTYTINSAYHYGGAISVQSGSISSTSNNYTNNSANLGGTISVHYGNLYGTNDYYANNNAYQFGGVICFKNGDIFNSISNHYINNSAVYDGGAIYSYFGNIYASNDHYENSIAGRHGGVIYGSTSDINSTSNQYINSSAVSDGGAIYVDYGNLYSNSDYYINSVASNGGAIYVNTGTINSTNDSHKNNRADYGGAIYVNSADIYSNSNHYTNNNAVFNGGAIYVNSSSIYENSVHYTNNSAGNLGGAIRIGSCVSYYCTSNYYISNSGEFGGAIYVGTCTIYSTNTYYINNSASADGGSIFAFLFSDIHSNSDYYTNNRAVYDGGAIYIYYGNIYATSDYYRNNSAGRDGGVILGFTSDINSISNQYVNNSAVSDGGAIYVEYGSNYYSNSNHYTNNKVVYNGGAIYSYFGNIYATSDYYGNNSAGRDGGVILGFTSDINSTSNQYINSSAVSDGGAIYIEYGNLYSNSDHYTNNSVDRDGGAVYADTGNIYSNSGHYTNNRAAYDGGVMYVDSGSIYGNSDHYVNNNANRNGGVSYVNSAVMYSNSDHHINNSAGMHGGAIYTFLSNVYSSSDAYRNNHADWDGGAVCVDSSNIYSNSDLYISNSADNNGGAIYAGSGSYTKLSKDNFEENLASEGAAVYKTGVGALEVNQSNMTDNFASNRGTVYMTNASLFSEGVTFMNNQGSLYVFNSQVQLNGTAIFINNVGDSGGAITAILSNILFNTTSTVILRNNTATNGGGMSLTQSSLHVYHSIELTDNYATDFGGGIYAYQSNIESKPELKQKSEITNNIASNGGAICAKASNILISNTDMYINSNRAQVNGGAMYLEQNSKIYIQKYEREFEAELKVKLYFTNNSAEKGGAIYVSDNTDDGVVCRGDNQTECFIQTLGLHQNVSQLNFINTFFSNNIASQTGSDIHGGLLDRCTINPNAELVRYNPEYRKLNGFDYIKATTQIEDFVDSEQTDPGYLITEISRLDVQDLISSDAVGVEFCLNNVLSPNYNHPNVSKKKGETFTVSLVAVDQVGNPLNATIISTLQSQSGNGRLKEGQVKQQVGNQCTELKYNVYSQDNSAHIHIHADGPCSDKGVSMKFLNVNFLPCNNCPVGYHPSPSENDCICECDQTSLVFCLDNVISPNYNYTEVWKKKGETFTVNLAAVDHVGTPMNATIISSFFSESRKGHLKDSQVVQQVGNKCTALEYSLYSHDDSAQVHISTYTESDTPCGNRVSTRTLNVNFLPCVCPIGLHPSASSRSENDCICECDQSSLVFCSDNANYNLYNVSIRKGEMFTVSLEAVDYMGNPVNATIISSFSSESGKGHLKDSQVIQQVGNQCTELEYNVYSHDNSAQVHINLYTDTPCGSRISTKIINLNFLPCTCPIGFQLSQSENDCICKCDQRLEQYQITSCFAENETILVEAKLNIWLGLRNYTNKTELIVHDCPFDYCVQKPVNISLSSPNSADEQCVHNRTGVLCGMCKEDLSLVFGSSRCQECSDNYISLLILFALGGITLVVVILLLNLTVASGTAHGLIMYVNFFTANHSFFLPPSTTNFLTVFISLLNLDLGIETCFYNGMDSYSKFLLQLAYPTYVLVLMVIIIVLCEVWDKFATLLGNRNPVAALSTLILLSYAKLIRTIITALQFTHIGYPDGPRKIVWLYDGNVTYFNLSHIPRFIAAFIIIILGTVYTILLLFGQWFPRCSNRKIMKWTKNTKYIALIDAYHAPFTPKHRYWIGLLLFAYFIHTLVAAMATGPVPILSVGCIVLGLILLKLLSTRIYKNRLHDSLETLFLTNIAVLVPSTFYIRETNESQLALANISMAISFILFLVILGYHFYKYILKGTRVWNKLTQPLQRRKSTTDTQQVFKLVSFKDHKTKPVEQEPPDANNQLREPALDILEPVYTVDYRATPSPPPIVHNPPKITYTVIDAIPKHENKNPVPCGPTGRNKHEVDL